MKKIWLCFLAVLLLAGCKAQETFETVNDVYAQPQADEPQKVVLALPEDVAVPAMESDGAGKLYLCDGYTVTVQTMESGDLNRTLKDTTGFSRDVLDVIETTWGALQRYECVWTAAGEAGDQVGRAVILDDGDYHYAVSVMADAATAGELSSAWNEIFRSVSLTDTAP